MEASGDLDSFSLLIHGEKKIGKTLLSLQDNPSKVLLIEFDPPQIAYKRVERHCAKYEDFDETRRALLAAAKNPATFPYKRVVIDRCDLWYAACFAYVCKINGCEHPNDMNDYGKTWKAIENKFNSDVRDILGLPCGKWFLCHSEWEEVEGRDGKIRKLLPNLTAKADSALNGMCDGYFAYAFKGKRRVLVLQGDERTGAGHRIAGHFLTTSGEPVQEVDMGTSVHEGYANFVKAFDNKLVDAQLDGELETSEGEVITKGSGAKIAPKTGTSKFVIGKKK